MGDKRVRMEFTLSPVVVTDLDELKDALGITARTDVVKYALALLQWAVRARRDGYTFLAERGEEQRVVVFLSPTGSVAGTNDPNDTPDKEGS